MKKKWSILIGMSLTIAMLTACGSSSEDSVGANESSQETGGVEEGSYITEVIQVAPVNASDYVTLGDYSQVPIASILEEVTQEDVDLYIQWGLESIAETSEITDTQRVVEYGDTVNIDFDGTIDGLPEDDTSADGVGYDLVIGSGSFIDGFEEGLVGANVGDSVTLNLVFPEVYPNNPDIQGNNAIFEVVIHSVKELIVPELTDEVATTFEPSVATIEEYREFVRILLEEEMLYQHEYSVKNEIFTYILANASYEEVPEDMILYYQNVYYNMVASYVVMYGMTMEGYVEAVGMTAEDFEEESFLIAEEMAKEYLTFKAVADAEGIAITQEEINAMAEEAMWMSGMAVDSVEEYLEQIGAIQVEHTLLAERVLEQIVQYAVYE
ncbi:MAG: trigger factor [Eubacteriales bacterium]